MAIDTTTLALLVDSTQVGTASAALDDMAAAGARAESTVTKLAASTKSQSSAIGSAAESARKSTLSFKSMAEAQAALGPKFADQIAEALGRTKNQADSTTDSIRKLADEVRRAAGASNTLPGAPTVPPKAPIPIPIPNVPTIDPKAAAFLASLAQQAANAGKTKAELLAMQAAELGVTNQAGPLIAQLVAASKATHGLTFETAAAKRELLVLAHELSQGNFKRFGGSLLVLGEQTGAASLLFSGLGLAMLSVIATIGAVGFAFVKGAQQSEEFGKALLLTGNFAGQTEGQFNALTKSVAQSTGTTIGHVREFADQLLRTGTIGPQVFTAAATAAAAYGQVSGKTAEDVAKDFAKMTEAPTQWAVETNRHLHFISAAQFEAIKGFEEQGKVVEAQSVIFDALNVRFGHAEQNLGTLSRTLNSVKSGWSSFWDAAFDIGRAQTIEDKIASTDKKIQQVRASLAAPLGSNAADVNAFTGRPTTGKAGLAALEQQQADQLRAQFRQTENAAAESFRAQAQQAGIAAREYGDHILAQSKSTDQLTKALEKNKLEFKAAADAGTPFTQAQQNIINEGTRRQNTRRGHTEADQVRQQKLAADLAGLKDALQQEKDAIVFHNKFLETQFKLGEVSIQQFYDDKRAITAAGVDAEIAELDKRKARIKVDLTTEKDPSEKIKLQKEIDDATRQQDKIRRDAADAVQLANQQEAISFKELNDKLEAYRSNLLQLQGDEQGSAQIRSKLIIEQAQLLAKQATPRTTGEFARIDRGQAPTVDVTGLQQATNQQNDLNRLKNATSQINARLQIEEDRIALAQQTDAVGEIDSLVKVGEARRKAVLDLEQIVKAQEAIAASRPKDFQLQIDTSKARFELEKLKASLDPLKDKFDNLLKDSFSSNFAELLNGKKSIKASILDFLGSVQSGINDSLSKDLASKIFGKGGVFEGAGGQISEKLFGKTAIDTTGISTSLNSLQSDGVDPTTAALVRLQQQIDQTIQTFTDRQPLTTGDFTRLDRGQTGEESITNLFKDATQPVDELNRSNAAAATSVLRMATAASRGGNALSFLPNIIQSLLNSGASKSAGGFLSSLFSSGGGGTTGASEAVDLGQFFSEGGWTGNMDEKKPAGVVHGKEIVFSAPAVRALGKDFLLTMQQEASNGRTPTWLRGKGISGARELGGPVGSDQMYLVNERQPELLQVGGKQYLMTGNNQGEVKQMSAMNGGSQTIINISVTPPAGSSRETAQQWGTTAGRHIQRSLRRNG